MALFETFGKLKGKTVKLGQGGRYEFVSGFMEVPLDDAGKIAKALRFLSAGPKGECDKLHAAACAKIGIDPVTGARVGTKAKSGNAGVAPVAAREPELSEEELNDVVLSALLDLDVTEDTHWTGAGKPALIYLKEQLPLAIHERVTRELVDSLEVTRESLAPAETETKD